MCVRLNISQAWFNNMNHNGETSLDLDSHANTCVLGNNALLVKTPYPDWTTSLWIPLWGKITKPILSGALKYTSPSTNGLSYILLVVHQQAIQHIDRMDNHSLICPM